MIKNNNNNNNNDAGTSSLCYGHIGHSLETKVLWPAKISDKKVNLVNYKKKNEPNPAAREKDYEPYWIRFDILSII